MTEAELQRTIIDLATLFGWRHYHTFNSRRSDPGFPDLVLLHEDRGRLLFIEVKIESGKPTPAQLAWLDALARCDEEIYIVRPANLDEIQEILTLGHKPGFIERCRYESAVVAR